MKKYTAFALIILLLISLCGCSAIFNREPQADLTADIRIFYNRVSECKRKLDSLATPILSKWNEMESSFRYTDEQINAAIQSILQQHNQTIEEIKTLDKEISSTYDKTKNSIYQYMVKQVMNDYINYRDCVLNANAALDTTLDITYAEGQLTSSLKNLRIEA